MAQLTQKQKEAYEMMTLDYQRLKATVAALKETQQLFLMSISQLTLAIESVVGEEKMKEHAKKAAEEIGKRATKKEPIKTLTASEMASKFVTPLK